MATISCPAAECRRKTKRIGAAVLCLIMVLCQGLVLDYYLAKYKGNVWWAWAAADAVNLAIFIFAFVISFKRLAARERDGRTSKDDYTAGGELPMGFTAWFVYACLLATRVGIIFEDFAQLLDENDFFGPNTLKTMIALTCITFMLLVATHHDAPHTTKRHGFIVSMSHTVTFNILDTVSILELLFIQDSHLFLPFNLHRIINAFACLNLILPVVPLLVLSRTRYGKENMTKVVRTIHTLLNLLVMNLPLFAIRMFLWHSMNRNISVFFIKNTLGIVFTVKDLWDDWFGPQDADDGALDVHLDEDEHPRAREMVELNTNPQPSSEGANKPRHIFV